MRVSDQVQFVGWWGGLFDYKYQKCHEGIRRRLQRLVLKAGCYVKDTLAELEGYPFSGSIEQQIRGEGLWQFNLLPLRAMME